MNSLEEIRARRAYLLARAAVERERVVLQLHAWEAPLALVDKSLVAARYVRSNPQWIVGALILFAVLRPRRAFAWARRGLVAWRTWRWLMSSLRNLASQKPA
jgi:hypothetical protein